MLDRLGAVEAVGELAQAAPDRLGALARAGLDLDPGDPQAGELGGDMRRDPALPGAGSESTPTDAEPISARFRRSGRAPAAARTRASSCAVGELADAGALQGAAGIDVGEGRAAADPVEAGDGAVAVVADRHLPAVLADQFAHRFAVVAHVQREEVHPPTVAP